MSQVDLHLGDCLTILPTLEAQSIDAIITDLPYGTTACSWDEVIPFAPMWEQVKRVLKPRGAFVTTASQPFTSKLVMSNVEWFKHQWIWDKGRGIGHLVAKFRPMQQTEEVVVFGRSGINYYPQMQRRVKVMPFGGTPNPTALMTRQVYTDGYTRPDYTHRFPTNHLLFEWSSREGLHPTQKPVALYAYLIRTYTNAGDTVLDFCMGSGTTGVAAVKEGRNFVGVELDKNYFAVAEKRIAEAAMQLPLLETI